MLAASHPAQAQNPPVPFYRISDGNWYFLTAFEDEYNSLITGGWTASPAPAGYVYLGSADATGLAPLYRLYFPANGDHFYTTSLSEKDSIFPYGFNDEGIACYVLPGAGTGLTPLYRAYNAGTGNHLFTGDVNEYNGLSSAWTQEGIAAYTLANAPSLPYGPPGYSQAAYSGGAVTGGTSGDGPYAVSPQNGQYGGMGTAMTSPASPSILSGTITARFTWSGGSANLPTPQSTVLAQTCDVEWSCDGLASGSNTCTNPLGGSVADWTEPGGNGSSQTWDETTYSVLTNPASPLAVTCAPYCYAGPADSFSYTDSSVFYTATVYPITISLAGTTPDPAAGNAQKALTGQQVTATLNYGGPGSVAYSWSTTGANGSNPFKTYYPTLASNQLVPLTAADYTNSTGSFSFYDEGSGDKVYVKCTATITFPDGTMGTVTAQSLPVTFVKPTVTKWGINTGYIQQFTIPKSPGNTFWGLYQDPKTTEKFGEDWSNIAIAFPYGFSAGGKAAFAQLITPDFEFIDGTTGQHTVETGPGYSNGVQGLDTVFGFMPWTLPGTGSGGDDPSFGLPNSAVTGYNGNKGDEYTLDDTFTTWLMYQPPAVGSQGTIWVPLQSYTWSANPIIEWNGSKWITSGNPSSDGTFTATNIDTPPTWTMIQQGMGYSPF